MDAEEMDAEEMDAEEMDAEEMDEYNEEYEYHPSRVIDFSIGNILPNIRWSYRNNSNSNSILSRSLPIVSEYDPINSVLSSSLNDTLGFKNVLSNEGKKQLKIINYDSSMKEKICPITQEEFEEGEEVIELPCKHIFNKDAIKTWVEKENAICPICRTGLESKEIKNNSTDPNSNELNNFRQSQTFPNFSNLINFITREQERIEEEQIQNAILESFQPPLETNETSEDE